MADQQLDLPKEMLDFDRDSKWFYENIDLLRKRGLTEKFVAIKGGKVIASGDNVDSVIDFIDKEGENPSLLFVEFVYPEGTVVLL